MPPIQDAFLVELEISTIFDIIIISWRYKHVKSSQYCSFIDLATQMQHLTNIPESPRISRASKVLSWISESEDMFEDAGVSEEHANSCELLFTLFACQGSKFTST